MAQTNNDSSAPTKPIFQPLSQHQLGKFKKLLLEISKEKAEGATFVGENLQTPGEHFYGSHQEHGTDTQSSTINSVTCEIYSQDGKNISRALERIDNKTFGRCSNYKNTDCEVNIDEGRLEVIPYTELCRTCGKKREVANLKVKK